MKNTISDLWNGNITPYEQCGAYDPVANKRIFLIERNREELSRGLASAQNELFRKYIDCTEEYLVYRMELAFCDGFSFGSKLRLRHCESDIPIDFYRKICIITSGCI